MCGISQKYFVKLIFKLILLGEILVYFNNFIYFFRFVVTQPLVLVSLYSMYVIICTVRQCSTVAGPGVRGEGDSGGG